MWYILIVNILLINTCKSDKRQAETINAMYADQIAKADAFAIVQRAGSWTGSRVGVVAVKAWSYATGKPIIELPEEDMELAKQKYLAGEFTDLRKLEPFYDSEFIVGKRDGI